MTLSSSRSRSSASATAEDGRREACSTMADMRQSACPCAVPTRAGTEEIVVRYQADAALKHMVPICAIGASAGGVKALQEFFSRCSDNLGLAYVVVIHLSPDHPSQLSEILAGKTTMPVLQVEDSPEIKADCVYVIAPGSELVIEGNTIKSRPISEPRGMRAPIDLFFQSVAAARGDGLAIVLSGAGSDGALGVRAIKEAGGVILVQDPGDAEYPMMPQSAIATDAVDFVEPIHNLVERIAEVVRSKKALRDVKEADVEDDLRKTLALLRARTGHDFANYKKSTVLRRITRRVQVTRQNSIAEYAAFLGSNTEEAKQLFSDLLISVTMFFRDSASFELLANKAIGPIFDRLGEDRTVRAWVVGCATGEEAYSLAILCLEEMKRREVRAQFQIFASDLDEGALSTAREGRYPKTIEADVSDDRLQNYFVEEGTQYRIRKEVRDVVLFSSHSALKDPPFIRLDLIACRNLMIYLEREQQRSLIDVFHYALKPSGYLFLGSAETADQSDLFDVVDRDARIYVAKPMVRRHLPALPHPIFNPRGFRSKLTQVPSSAPTTGKVHAAALEMRAPPSVLVDAGHRVLHLSETVGRYFRPSHGSFSNELPELVSPELRIELKLALHRVFEHNEPSLTLPIPVMIDGELRRVVIHASPFTPRDRSSRQALIFFIDGGPSAPRVNIDETNGEATDDVRRLHEALTVSQERLSEGRREYEAATQDLRAANEELQSINEEYRSTSEELETSKEELQSMNEELQTVNAELKIKLENISAAHNDLQNLMAATEIGTLFLDPSLHIRLFTPTVAEHFNITETDIGRPITDFTHKLVYDNVVHDAAKVLRDFVPIETEVRTKNGHWLMMRLRPYRTTENRIEGVVVTLFNVTARHTAEAGLRESEERYRSLFESMAEGFLLAEIVRDENANPMDILCADANPAAKSLIDDEIKGRHLGEVLPDVMPALNEVAARVEDSGQSERHELLAASQRRWFEFNFSAVNTVGEAKGRVAVLFQDVTSRKNSEVAQRRMIAELNHRVKNMLAVVQSVASQTKRTSGSLEEFNLAFQQRLSTLAKAHDLLTTAEWVGADFSDVVKESIALLLGKDTRRVTIDGPSVPLSPNGVIAMAMIIHELGTNAVKYGALSNGSGAVTICWQIIRSNLDAKRVTSVRLRWSETGGPRVVPPQRKGFGTRMVKDVLAIELSGTAELEFEAAGLQCIIEFPVDTQHLN